MYYNLKNYTTKALIVSALLGSSSVMMPAFAAVEHGMVAPAVDGRVKGTVTDDKGEPLTGVVIRVVGADVSYAAVTDLDGKFTLKVPNKKSMLEIRGVGYKTKRISAQGDLNIKMEEDISNLNEVVVIGYGTLDKKEVTSAITSIKGKDLMVGVGGADVSSALQGKISGLVMNNIGSPNSETTFQLRGMTSINAGRSPLIVIDGFPGGDIRSLTQEDIASIDVLKDASAGAIYGTRAASGVILITTKSGTNTSGQLNLTYANEFSHRQTYNAPKMLSGREYAEHNIGTDYGTDTDWWDEMINHKNFSTKHHLSLQYGTDKAQVYTSLYYNKMDGVAIVDSRKDYGGRFNAKFKLFDDSRPLA